MARAAVATIEAELAETRVTVGELEAGLSERSTRLEQTEGDLAVPRAESNALGVELETTRRALDVLDAHAEAIEAELADARRAADNSETRRELETALRNLAGANDDLAVAREELGSLEAKRAADRRGAGTRPFGARGAAPRARRGTRRDPGGPAGAHHRQR